MGKYIIYISDGPLPGILHEVDLPIINNNDCEGMYRDAGYIEHIPYIFICAGYSKGGKDSCEVNSPQYKTLDCWGNLTAMA